LFFGSGLCTVVTVLAGGAFIPGASEASAVKVIFSL
jgi:hypothetical protein